MMSFKTSLVVVIFALALVSSNNATESLDELYWKLKLGSIAMPKVLKSSLQSGSNDKIVKVLPQFQVDKDIGISMDYVPVQQNNFWYTYANPVLHEFTSVEKGNLPFAHPRHHANPVHQDSPVQFLTYEKLSTLGTKMKLHFRKIDDGRKFLPLYVRKSMATASNKLEAVLNILSVNLKSNEAKYIAQMFKDCERKDLRDEVIYCATSLKDMVDFVTSSSNSGKNKFMAVSTEEERHITKEYTIQNTQKISNDDNNTVVCHRMNNPFVVFLCHTISSTEVYNVSLLGANGNQMNAIAVCHKDTSEWYRGHIAFQVLNLEPGSKTICHILSGDAVVWLQNES